MLIFSIVTILRNNNYIYLEINSINFFPLIDKSMSNGRRFTITTNWKLSIYMLSNLI